MSIWIRAIMAKPAGDLTPSALREGLAARLPRVAPLYGEDHEAALARLAVGGEAPLREGEITYREGHAAIRFTRQTARASVRKEAARLRAALDDCDEDGVDEVRERLDQAVEIAAFELSLDDCEGAGWPIAIAAALTIAARGEGIVQADGEGWMEPDGSGVEHVLDGD